MGRLSGVELVLFVAVVLVVVIDIALLFTRLSGLLWPCNGQC